MTTPDPDRRAWLAAFGSALAALALPRPASAVDLTRFRRVPLQNDDPFATFMRRYFA